MQAVSCDGEGSCGDLYHRPLAGFRSDGLPETMKTTLWVSCCLVGLWIIWLLCWRSSGRTAVESGIRLGSSAQPSAWKQDVGGGAAFLSSLRARAEADGGTANEAERSFGPMRLYEAVATWPASHGVAKVAIENFAQALGLHDAIRMDPGASDEEILARGLELGVHEEFLRDSIPDLFWVEDSFQAHLERSLLHPELRQVHDVMVASGVWMDLQDDRLLDGFRLCAFNTVFGGFMAEQARDTVMEGRPVLPVHHEEIQRCLDVRDRALETVAAFFRERFVRRHGLSPEMASRLVENLSRVEVHRASPPSMAVPRIRKR